MKHLLAFLSGIALTSVGAQTVVDRPVVLEGATTADRRVSGLADPGNEQEALNARTAQAGARTFAVAPASDAWTIVLDPTSSAPVPGTALSIRVTTDNTGPVTITVNGSGPWPVLKNATADLAGGDVRSGETVALVFDGTAFQLTSARRLERRPCPSGSVQVNELYCIETAQRDSLTYYQAAVLCGDLNGRLCSWGEWFSACSNSATLGLANMVGDWEWTNNAANADFGVRVVGQANCSHAGVADGYVNARRFRCCYKR